MRYKCGIKSQVVGSSQHIEIVWQWPGHQQIFIKTFESCLLIGEAIATAHKVKPFQQMSLFRLFLRGKKKKKQRIQQSNRQLQLCPHLKPNHFRLSMRELMHNTNVNLLTDAY